MILLARILPVGNLSSNYSQGLLWACTTFGAIDVVCFAPAFELLGLSPFLGVFFVIRDFVASIARGFLLCVGRNRQPPAATEGLAAHLQEGSCLSAFEFRPSEQAFDPLHITGIVTGGHQLIPAEPMFDQIDQQRIQPVVVGERVAVLLVWA